MVIDLKMYSSSRSIKKNQALLDDIDYNWLTSTSNKGTGLCLAALGCSGRERERKGEKEREREKGRERERALTAMEVGPRLSASCSESY